MLSNLDPDPSLTLRIRKAMERTRLSDAQAWGELLDAIDPRKTPSKGSVALRPDFAGDLESVFLECGWSPFEDPGLNPSLLAFRTFDLAGYMGVVDLATLPPHLEVRLADRNRTGFAEAEVFTNRGASVPFTTIVLGPGRGGVEWVWSINPGPTIVPSTVPTPARPSDREIDVKTALKLGMKWARCVPTGS